MFHTQINVILLVFLKIILFNLYIIQFYYIYHIYTSYGPKRFEKGQIM